MKRAFIIIGMAGGAGLVMSGCIDLEPLPATGGSSAGEGEEGEVGDDRTEGTEGGDETATGGGDDGCEEACPHGLSGELMLFVNGRLSNADALYQNNLPLPEPG